MKKRGFSLILAFAMVLSLLPAAALAARPDEGFTDTRGHWGESSIDRWSGYDIIEGYEGLFYPDQNMTRGGVAKVLANLLGLTKQADLSGYTDIDSEAWYYEFMAKCVAAGIFEGDGANRLNPDEPISRQEMFTVFARALGIAPKADSDTQFTDDSQIASWAAGYIGALADQGIVTGGGDGSVDPTADIDRASVMALLDKGVITYVTTDGATVSGSDGIVLVVADNVTVTGSVDTLVVAGGSNTVTVSSGTVDNVAIVGPEDTVVFSGTSQAGDVTIPAAAEGSSVVVESGAAVDTVTSEASNVTISGSGAVDNAVVSGDNTSVSTGGTTVDVAEGTSGVTVNDTPVSGGETVETEPTTPETPPVHIHIYDSTTHKCPCGAFDPAVVATIGTEKGYLTLADAVAAATEGQTVKLRKNVTLADRVDTNFTGTIDLGGHTIGSTATCVNGSVFNVKSGTVTIKNGSMVGIAGPTGLPAPYTNECDVITVRSGATANLEDLSISIDSQTGACAYAFDGGRINVKSGTYTNSATLADVNGRLKGMLLNQADGKAQAIFVTGGTFHGANPASGDNSRNPSTFLAAGYQSTGSEGNWTVSCLFAGGSGTESDPFLIANATQLKYIYNVYLASDGSSTIYYKLASDITVSKVYTVGNYWSVVVPFLYHSVFDGNGKTITVADADNDCRLFYDVMDAEIKNLNVVLDDAMCVNADNTTFNNVDVSGSFEVGNNTGAYVIYAWPESQVNGKYTTTLNFIDCDANVTMIGEGATANYNAVFVGYAAYRAETVESVKTYYDCYENLNFTNCTNEGTLICGKASMFLGNVPSSYAHPTITVTNCSNNGLIQATNMDSWTYSHFVSSNAQYATVKIGDNTYTGTNVSAEKLQMTCGGSGSFVHGPRDESMKLTKNSAGNFVITPSTNSEVAYYVVSMSLYARLLTASGELEGGSIIVNVSERVDTGTDYTTTLKHLPFVDEAWVTANTEAVSSTEGANTVYTLGSNSYYYFGSESETHATLSGTPQLPNIISVSAYDSSGKLISSASLSST